VFDLHVDTPYHVHYGGRAPDLRVPGSDVTRGTLRSGRVLGVALSLYVPRGLTPRVLPFSELESVLRAAESIAARSGFALGVPAGEAASASMRVVFGVEEGEPLARAIDRLPELVARGVALFGLVHAHHNTLADSSTDPYPMREGLTPLGRRYVEAVYAAGGLIDLAHASDASFAEVEAIAARLGRPLVVSHANARAVTAHPRNLTDAQLLAIARSGGVVGVMFHAPVLRDDAKPATLGDVVRHIRHLLSVAGPAHVAIGSDLDGLVTPVRGLRTHADLPALFAALREKGVDESTLRALAHGNALRVLRFRTRSSSKARSRALLVPPGRERSRERRAQTRGGR
jgi:membrane dipeptidase